MGSFTASLRAIGDVRALPATVELSDGRLSIVAGSTEIGTWSLDEIRLEEIPTGYRMAAEGEQIVIELRDAESFAAELATRSKKKRVFGKRKSTPSAARDVKRTDAAPVVIPNAVAREPEATPEAVLAPLPATPPSGDQRTTGSSGTAHKGVGIFDRILAKAQKRFGPYLPDWMFSRAMFVLAFAGLVAMFLLPGLFSVLLLIAGALLVLFGAVVYSDTVLASKWLPGRATPIQGLLLGLCVLLLGVLLGMIAN